MGYLDILHWWLQPQGKGSLKSVINWLCARAFPASSISLSAEQKAEQLTLEGLDFEHGCSGMGYPDSGVWEAGFPPQKASVANETSSDTESSWRYLTSATVIELKHAKNTLWNNNFVIKKTPTKLNSQMEETLQTHKHVWKKLFTRTFLII